MNRMFGKRLISFIISFVLIVSVVLPVVTLAAGNDSSKTSMIQQIDPKRIDKSKLNVKTDYQTDEIKGNEHSLDEIVRVTIQFETSSAFEAGYDLSGISSNTQAVNYRKLLLDYQKQIVSKIEKAIGKELKVVWNLTLLINAVSAEVRYGDIPLIESLSFVKKVVVEKQYETEKTFNNETDTAMTTSDSMVNAISAWADGFTGIGTKIAILDTGIAYNHQSFDVEAYLYAVNQLADALGKSLDDYDIMTIEDVQQAIESGILNVDIDDSVYLNEKIPYAFNYKDFDNDVTHDNDRQTEHGSHVAGIAAANRYIKIGNEFKDAATEVMAVGVAPDAQILVMKIFGKNGGPYDSDTIAAVEDAITLGCDSINMSLGVPFAGFSVSDDQVLEVFSQLYGSEIVLANSKGNSYAHNTFPFTEGALPYNYIDDVSLATAGGETLLPSSFSVASCDSMAATDYTLVFDGFKNIFYTSTSSEYNIPALYTIAGEYDYVYIKATGLEDVIEAVDAVIDIEGKVVIVDRGDISFIEKIRNIASAGAVAAIVANNAPGIIAMDLSKLEDQYKIPSVTIQLLDAQSVISNCESSTSIKINEDLSVDVYCGKVEIGGELVQDFVNDYYKMSTYSSWGVAGSLLLTPEITAPGGGIYSVNGSSNSVTDAYEVMSGTSMSAPHVAGALALFKQYYDEVLHDKLIANGWLFTSRQMAQSLLMSTADVMYNFDDEYYYPVMQQGAGVMNIYDAISANTFIMMKEDATPSCHDGKVKVELGQNLSGKFDYSFTIYNPSEVTMFASIDSWFYTQNLFSDGTNLYIDESTIDIPFSGEYEFEILPEHDVNKDGVTDSFDVDTILEWLTGNYTEDLDVDVCDMDNDGVISSRDAQLLLEQVSFVADEYADAVLLPHSSRDVTVHIELDEDMLSLLSSYFTSGSYIEGYTYLDLYSKTLDDEIIYEHHSIPVLGFYGSWTDSSMFEPVSLIDSQYTDKLPYAGNYKTNYIDILRSGARKSAPFMGNPYVDTYTPKECYALRSDDVVIDFNYTLTRSASSVFFGIGTPTDYLDVVPIVSFEVAPFYHVNNDAWYFTDPSVIKLGISPSDYGFMDGDTMKLDVIALPEYYSMQYHQDLSIATLTPDEFLDIMDYNDESLIIGDGAFLDYTFNIDDTAPVVSFIVYHEDDGSLMVDVLDNFYAAYVAVYDVTCNTLYCSAVPESGDVNSYQTVEFDLSEYELNSNAVVLFVGDYACNETAYLLNLDNDQTWIYHDIYKMADEFEAGNEYLIGSFSEANINTAQPYDGIYNILYAADADTYVKNYSVEVNAPDDKYDDYYIDSDDLLSIDNSLFYTIDVGEDDFFVLYNIATDSYVGCYLSYGATMVSWSNPKFADIFRYNQEHSIDFITSSFDTAYLAFDVDDSFILSETPDLSLRIFTKDQIKVPFDSSLVNSIDIEPENVGLIMDIKEQEQLYVTVKPFTALNKTIHYMSMDDAVATVDENGLVTAHDIGETYIVVYSDDGNALNSVHVSVVDSNPTDALVNGFFNYKDNTMGFGEIDLNDMSISHLYDYQQSLPIFTGTRDGDDYYFIDDYYGYLWKVENDEIDNPYTLLQFSDSYTPVDIAALPDMVITGDTDTKVIYDFAFITADSNICFSTEDGKILYYDMQNEFPDMIGISYYMSEPGMAEYLLQLADGTIGIIAFAPDSATGGDLLYGYVGQVKGLVIPEGSHVSMTNGYDQLGVDSYFISVSGVNGIFYVDISDDNTKEFEAVYVGSASDSVNNIGFLYTSDDGSDAEKIIYVELDDHIFDEEVQRTEDEKIYEKIDILRPTLGGKAFDVEYDNGYIYANYHTHDYSYNGLLEIKYDTAALEFLEFEYYADDLLHLSCKYNEPDTIIIAYASLVPVSTDDILATLTFEQGCDKSQLEIKYLEWNEKVPADIQFTERLYGGGHVYDFAGFEWDENYTFAKARFVCEYNDEHVKVVPARVHTETEVGCEEEGTMKHIAEVFFEGVRYEDVVETPVKATGHNYFISEFEFNEDYTSCTIHLVCENDESHVKELITTDITHEENELEDSILHTYFATAEDDGITYEVGDSFETSIEQPTEPVEQPSEDEIVYDAEPEQTEWTPKSNEDLVIDVTRSDDESIDEHIQSVEIDGKALTENDYSVEDGKVVISNEYLKDLEPGDHELVIHFDDGDATTTFTVLEQVPETDTSDNNYLPIILLVVSVIALGVLLFFLIRKRKSDKE